MTSSTEQELAFLLDFDGARYLFDAGYWVKIEVRRVDPTPARPHGLAYSFTLHDPAGKRLLGFDNAHGVAARGGRYQARSAATGIARRLTRADPTNSSRRWTWCKIF